MTERVSLSPLALERAAYRRARARRSTLVALVSTLVFAGVTRSSSAFNHFVTQPTEPAEPAH